MDPKELLTLVLGRLDRLDDRQDRMEKTTDRQQLILEEHMRRTKANEDLIELLKARQDQSVTWPFLGKALGMLAIVAGLAEAAFKIFGG